MTRMNNVKKTATSDVLAYQIIGTVLKLHQKLGKEEMPSTLPSGQVAYLQNNPLMHVRLEMPPTPAAVGNATYLSTLHLSTRVSFNTRVDMLGHFFQNHCIGENDTKFQSNTHILDPGIKSRCVNFCWERSVVDRGGFSMFS